MAMYCKLGIFLKLNMTLDKYVNVVTNICSYAHTELST